MIPIFPFPDWWTENFGGIKVDVLISMVTFKGFPLKKKECMKLGLAICMDPCSKQLLKGSRVFCFHGIGLPPGRCPKASQCWCRSGTEYDQGGAMVQLIGYNESKFVSI